MKPVFIVGAGGFGRELLAWCMHDPAYGHDWQVAGFIDDDPDALNGFGLPVGVSCGVSSYTPGATEELLCAIGLPSVKRAVVGKLKARGARFRTYVHPTVVRGARVSFGEGVVLCPGVVLTCDIRLGDFVMFNCGASAGHDVRVGAFSTISGHCDLTGFVDLGEEVFMGSGARIIPSRKIGDRAIVGAGSTVIMNVQAGSTVMGVPAMPLAGFRSKMKSE